MSKIVVYTAIANHYDRLKEPPAALRNGVDFVAFLDEAPVGTVWQTRKICAEFADPCRNAKVYKIRPHLFFPEAAYSLWIDGSVQLGGNFSIQQLIDEQLQEHDLAVFRHRERQCIYAEATECIRLHKDDPAIIERQMAVYQNEKYPREHGLAECGILLRRHTEKVQQFNEVWYEEITRHSRRDQLSFNYVARKTGLAFRYLPGSLNPGANPWFEVQPHGQLPEEREITARDNKNFIH